VHSPGTMFRRHTGRHVDRADPNPGSASWRAIRTWLLLIAGTAGAFAATALIVLGLQPSHAAANPSTSTRVPSWTLAPFTLPTPAESIGHAERINHGETHPVSLPTGEARTPSPGGQQPPPASRVTYLAVSPDNIRGGGAVVQACSACSGGAKVGYIGYQGTLTFPDITAQATEHYSLVIAYVNGGVERTATLTVNGKPVTLGFRGTDNDNWDFVQRRRTPVTLHAGINTIEFSNPDGWAPDIANITVP
jgi:hypothetical protein